MRSSRNLSNPQFNQRKALHALLFVVAHVPKPANVYNVLKCLYYADRKHLQEYGRQIYGDTFYALEHGPVPGGAYDIIKYVNGRMKWDLQFPEAFELLEVNDHYLDAKGKADTDLLSKSDMACLLDAAKKYGTMPFGKLKKVSHQGKAFDNADQNGEMKLSDLIDELKGAEAVAAHLRDRAPGEAHVKGESAQHAKRRAA
ncbi:MAG: Panacea domain-containing protein [Steroidobacteraceae bacterium]